MKLIKLKNRLDDQGCSPSYFTNQYWGTADTYQAFYFFEQMKSFKYNFSSLLFCQGKGILTPDEKQGM